MSLFFATLVVGIFLVCFGAALLMSHSIVASALKAFPRSQAATFLFFGAASLWFLYRIWTLSMADFGEFRVPLFIFFSAIAALSFYYVPDFLSVRGLAGLILLAAMPLLDASYMRYEFPILVFKAGIFAAIFIALWLGAQPYRMRDFISWLFQRPSHSKAIGGGLLGYGLLLCVISFAT